MMLNKYSKIRNMAILLVGLICFSFAHAQTKDDRWQNLTPGYFVDIKTFEAITVADGVNKGKRWINAWVRWQAEDGSSERVKMGAMCDDRTLQISEFLSIGTNGKETYEKQYKELPVTPNGQWEPVHTELCKRGKQWWKVF
jgi:hypothetical protein